MKDRNTAKPSKGQIKTIHGLKGTMKGIKTYRDAENYIKRLRRASKISARSNPSDGISCKLRDQVKAKDKADRLPIIKNATDCQRVRLPKIDVKKVRKCGGSGKAKCSCIDHVKIAKNVDTALNSLFDAVITLMNTVSFEVATENSK